MLKKFIVLYLTISMHVYADNTGKSQVTPTTQLESQFMPQTQNNTFTITSTVNQVNWPVGLAVEIDNQWQFSFKSSKPITISRIAVAIDDTTIANQINLQLKPEVPAHYFLSDVNLQKVVESIVQGYKFIGVYKQISSNDFAGFSIYKYKTLQVTISWLDSFKNYNQSTSKFMLVMAK